MGIFNKLFGNGERVKVETPADKIVSVIREKTSIPCIKMHPAKEKCTLYNSKIGGMPYLPIDFPYPTESLEEEQERPLRLLAQVNFEEMPPLEGFPTTGMLQFYISDGGMYGLNFEELTLQKGFRVIYHEKVDKEAELISALPSNEGKEDKEMFPVSDELKLNFELSEMPMGGGDFRFDKLVLETYNEVHPANRVSSLERISEEITDGVYDQLEGGGHHIGGYPMFTQIDPREYHENLQGHTVLLFQLDSEKTKDYSILWGDSGVCHFFIKPEDLAGHDFSNVLYNWDCY